MLRSSNHIIKRQVIELTTNSNDGFAIQQEISHAINDRLMKEMDLLFNRLVPADKWIQIKELNIELGNINREDLESTFMNQTLMAVEKELLSRFGNDPCQHSASLQVQTGAEKVIRAFIHFLEKGFLPWNFSVTAHPEFEKQLVEAFMNFTDAPGDCQEQLKKVFEQDRAVKRFVNQFSDEVFQSLVLLFSNAEKGVIHNELSGLKKFIQQAMLLKQEQFNFHWASTKELIVAGIPVGISENIVKKIETKLVQNLFSEAGKKIFSIPVNPKLLQTVLEENCIDTIVKIKSNKEVESSEAKALQSKEIAKGTKETEGIYISNAGLVILAPFLSAFFKQAEISDGPVVTDKSKAVCLLQYLAGFEDGWKEYDLPLNKILCGCDPGERIDTDILLSEKEKLAAKDLLKAVTTHWKTIGNTSIEGLQESFIQRKGKLSGNDKTGWLLQVEQKSYDMLLEKLPWSISIIKLSWMKNILKTEWVN